MLNIILHKEVTDSMITKHVDIAKKEVSKINCAKLTKAIAFLIKNDIEGLELSHTLHFSNQGVTVQLRDTYGIILDMYQSNQWTAIARLVNIPRLTDTITKVLDIKANKDQWDVDVKMKKSKESLALNFGLYVD